MEEEQISIDKLKEFKALFVKEVILSGKVPQISGDIIDDFIRFIDEKQNPVDPDQVKIMYVTKEDIEDINPVKIKKVASTKDIVESNKKQVDENNNQ